MTFVGDAPGNLPVRAGIDAKDLRREIHRAVGGQVATVAFVNSAVAAALATLPTPPTAFNIVRKDTATSRSSTTTLAVDPTLQVTVNANGRYSLQGRVRFSTSVVGGFKWTIDGPTAASMFIKRLRIMPGTTVIDGIAIDTAYPATQTLVVAATTPGLIEFDLDILVGGSPGTVGFWWAQGVSDGGATQVLAGSHLGVL